jgi:hypothetical protein
LVQRKKNSFYIVLSREFQVFGVHERRELVPENAILVRDNAWSWKDIAVERAMSVLDEDDLEAEKRCVANGRVDATLALDPRDDERAKPAVMQYLFKIRADEGARRSLVHDGFPFQRLDIGMYRPPFGAFYEPPAW